MEELYSTLARYYDLMYANKNYKEEAEILHSIIQKRKRSDGNMLLDVACGTGRHIEFLKVHYDIVGLDLNEDMLRIAWERNRDVEFVQGDMTSFKIDRQFDAIICLFGSINYVRTMKRLDAAIAKFTEHLKNGGALIIEPIFTAESFRDEHLSITCVDNTNCKIARVGVSRRKGNIALLEMHYLIAVQGEIRHIKEIHEMGLFTRRSIVDTLSRYGLTPEIIKGGLGRENLFVGVKT